MTSPDQAKTITSPGAELADNTSSADGHGRRFAYILGVSAWLGLVFGATEALLVSIQVHLLGYVSCLGINNTWMAPLASMGTVMVLGSLLAIPAVFLPRNLWRYTLVPIVLLCVFSLLLLDLQGHLLGMATWAKWLLSAGVAVQATRIIMRQSRFPRFACRSAAAIVLAVVVCTAASHAYRAFREQRAMNQLPPARPDAPNILFIVWDTVRAQSVHSLGYSANITPRFDSLIREGVLFESAITPAPWTLPTHAAMFTGLSPRDLSTGWFRPLNDVPATLAEVVSGRGYATAGFAGNFMYCGLDSGLGRGFAHYDAECSSPGALLRGCSMSRQLLNQPRLRSILEYYDVPGRRGAVDINNTFFGWLDRQPPRPFFAFLNYFDAHAPYLPPEDVARQFQVASKDSRLRMFRWQTLGEEQSLLPENLEIGTRAYHAGIAYLDRQLGTLMDELARRNLRRNTIIVVVSDHGEHLGEHGKFDHAYTLYRALTHVPLAIVWPKAIPAGKRVRAFASLTDLPATIMDLAGIQQHPLHGRTLARLWQEGQPADETPVFSELTPSSMGDPDAKAVWLGDLYYIAYYDRKLEFLFDFRADPEERHNLLDTPEGQRRAAPLRNALTKKFGKPRE